MMINNIKVNPPSPLSIVTSFVSTTDNNSDSNTHTTTATTATFAYFHSNNNNDILMLTDKESQQQQSQFHHHHQEQEQLHFIFGYGSLINKASRARSLAWGTADAHPVRVKGFKRGFNYRCNRRHYTAVGISPDESAACSGVLVQLLNPLTDLIALDSRENEYDRVQVNVEDIEFYDPSTTTYLPLSEKEDHPLFSANVIIWAYQTRLAPASRKPRRPPIVHQGLLTPVASEDEEEVQFNNSRFQKNSDDTLYNPLCESTSLSSSPVSAAAPFSKTLFSSPTSSIKYDHTIHRATPMCPIPQSYIDCVLQGCLSYGMEFAREFILTTEGFQSGTWVDDRESPQSIRRYVFDNSKGELAPSKDEIETIDLLLVSLVPEAFRRRVDWGH